MTAPPRIAGRKPGLVSLKAGEPVFWCACGRSARQPFCDGSHKGTDFAPVRHEPDFDGEALFCLCKRTRTPPFCDGSHNGLSDKYADASLGADGDARLVGWTEQGAGRAIAGLDNGCFVVRIAEAAHKAYGALSLARAIATDAGARRLSYFTGLLARGASDVLSFPGSDTVIFAVDGPIDLEISGRRFLLKAESGAFVGKQESFRLHNAADKVVRVDFAVCPHCPSLQTLTHMPRNFDESAPLRVIDVDDGKRQPMADRFYQVLVDATVGGCAVTQFIGEIPLSRAEHHRHLYEEAILILRGEGVMWTDRTKATVKAGDLIFLPMRQAHSLECLSPDGMRLMGVFYPSGSPAINY